MTQLSDEEALELFRTIADFVNAPDWDASRRVYDANPVLAEPVALEAIDGMIAATLEEGDQQKARLLAVHKDLLTLSARIGPDEAFEQIATPADAQLLQTIADFVNAANWEESRAILDAHPELLGPQASATFEALIRTAENTNDTKRAQLLTAHRDLLIRVNAVGADEAFAEIEQPFDPELLETIAQFVYAGSTEASRTVLDAHPELLDEQTDAIIERLIDDAQREGESELAVLLTIHRDLLRRTRDEGADAAFAAPVDFIPEDDIMQRVVEFVNAGSVEASRAVLEANPELLSAEANEAFELLIQTAQAQGRSDMVHHLGVYRDLLRVVQEVGIDSAFQHVASPDELLGRIVETTLEVKSAGDEEIMAQWRGQLGTFNEQARTLGDEPMARFTDAVARLFLGASPKALNPDLPPGYAAAWQRIVEGWPE